MQSEKGAEGESEKVSGLYATLNFVTNKKVVEVGLDLVRSFDSVSHYLINFM